MASDPPRPAELPPGYDEEDPYAEADLETYPDWWRRNVEEFAAYDMRPYRPPRLADGTISPPFLEALEDEYDVTLQFRSHRPVAEGWTLVVDGEPVRQVEHERDGGGFTRFHIDPVDLEAAVREATQRSR